MVRFLAHPVDVQHKYFTAASLEDILKRVNIQIITRFVKYMVVILLSSAEVFVIHILLQLKSFKLVYYLLLSLII